MDYEGFLPPRIDRRVGFPEKAFRAIGRGCLRFGTWFAPMGASMAAGYQQDALGEAGLRSIAFDVASERAAEIDAAVEDFRKNIPDSISDEWLQ